MSDSRREKVGRSSGDVFQQLRMISYTSRGQFSGHCSLFPSSSFSSSLLSSSHSGYTGSFPKENISHMVTPKLQTSDLWVNVPRMMDSGAYQRSGRHCCVLMR